MHKDVIYIDTEDDITAIIGKIKGSKEKIVALVPPKRIGVLQSAVNLRLLARMADKSSKRLVIVTSNKALINLSSVAKIPIARNLQSKPEMAEIDALEIEDGEDIIDGKQLPVGDLMNAVDADGATVVNDEVIESIDLEKDIQKTEPTDKLEKSEVKIPNFVNFRRKLFVGIVLLIGLTGFMVWAIVYAPAAKVVITAKTSPESVSRTVKLGGTAATDLSKGIIQTISKQIKKDVSISFVATGEKNVGNKATGIVSIENCDSNVSFTIDANTTFEASTGQKYVNSTIITVPGFTGSASVCRMTRVGAGKVDVPVVAVESGESSNISAKDFVIDGVVGDIYAEGGAMTGGTTKISTVVTAADIEKASQALTDLSSDSVKQQLIKQFTNGESVILDSFNVVHEAPVSVPAVDQEVVDKTTLTSATTFSINAISKVDVEMYLNDELSKKVATSSQRIYNNGVDKVKLSEYLSTEQGSTVKISTDGGQIGPNIDKDLITQQIKGLKFGDAQALISSIIGVSNVDIQFSYFWVKSLPKDIEKIDVQFTLQDA